MKRLPVCLLVWVLTLSLSTAAGDLAAPDYRGEPDSTCQEWDFLHSSTPATEPAGTYFFPDGTGGITDVPFGPSLANITGTYSANTGPEFGGAWLNYEADLFLRNSSNLAPDSYKLLRVQATYHGEAPVVAVESAGGLWTPEPATTIELSGGWSVLVQDWYGQPNPQAERVILTSPGQLSEVIVDTICLPEPAAIALLTVGLALIGRRRRIGAGPA